MGFYLEGDTTGALDGPSEGQPKKDLAAKLNETAEKEALEYCGPGNPEAVGILRYLCPTSNVLHLWSHAGDPQDKVRVAVAHIPQWREYGVSLFFPSSEGESERELTLTYTESGALRSCFWSETSKSGAGSVSVSEPTLIPNEVPGVEEEARVMAMEYLRTAHERGTYRGANDGCDSDSPPSASFIRQ